MLSNETIAMIEELKDLEYKIKQCILKETGNKYGFCMMPDIQLWADADFQHDLAELEELVGPIKAKYTTENDEVCYAFNLGRTSAIVIMPATTSDSRGEACDVRADKEA